MITAEIVRQGWASKNRGLHTYSASKLTHEKAEYIYIHQYTARDNKILNVCQYLRVLSQLSINWPTIPHSLPLSIPFPTATPARPPTRIWRLIMSIWPRTATLAIWSSVVLRITLLDNMSVEAGGYTPKHWQHWRLFVLDWICRLGSLLDVFPKYQPVLAINLSSYHG